MTDVTVRQLAEVVGTPVERLLKQMQEAGLSHTGEDEVVSDEDKQTLLSYLKSSHGEKGAAAPRKITLKRKTQGTLKAARDQGKKTVNVEVRRKRTYVKRASEEGEMEAAPAPEAVPAPEASGETTGSLDPEVLRQQALAKRKEQEAEEEARREEQARAREAARTAAPAEPAPPPSGRLSVKRKSDRDRDEEKTKTRTRPKKAPRSIAEEMPRKVRAQDVSLDALDEVEETLHMPRGGGGRRKAKLAMEEQKRHGFAKPTEAVVREVTIPEVIAVSELARKMAIKGSDLVRTLMKMGTMVNINQTIDQETAAIVVEELGHKPVMASTASVEDTLVEDLTQVEGTPEPRAPVVSVMGHVDHGKTSLLDHIRKTRVATGEAGGITQHIGAYHVETGHGMITFLDTPGHAAFTAMRARGAQSTDIVVLVVAADDGVMPQTEEAIQHARAAEVPLVVAINKMDKDNADPERVKNELAAKEVIPEDWGGDVQFVAVSAETGQGIENLLEAILLQSELLELKAPRDVPARGLVLESRLEKGRGAVASLLVQDGILHQGDIVLAGQCFGRVRAMNDENGQATNEAGPSIPVEVLGLDGTPDAGDEFFVVEDERKAREVAEFRQERDRELKLARQQSAKLDTLFETLEGSAEKTVLHAVVKADVRGSLEAILSALAEIGTDEWEVRVVGSGVGGITETDINLALTSNAVVFGFNVRADSAARKLVEKEGVDLRYYSVIYDLLDDVKQALAGLLKPELREEIIGVAEVREVFKSPKFGQIAGCMVVEGTVYRNKPIRVLRDDVVIYEGELESLRRFKDDVNEVRNGMECGIGVKNYKDVRPGDKIEVYDTREIERTVE